MINSLSDKPLPERGGHSTRAHDVKQSALIRRARARRTIDLTAVTAAGLTGSILAVQTGVAGIGPPHLRAWVIAATIAAAAACAWTWLRRSPVRLHVRRREWMDAVDLAPVMVVDDRNVIRHWSRGCEYIYGWSAAEALGRDRGKLLHTQIDEAEQLWPRLKADRRLDNDVSERHRDGRDLAIRQHVELFDQGEGQPAAIVSVTDVTELRRAEAALRLSEARLATAVSIQGIFIYEYDLIADRMIWATQGDERAESTANPGATLNPNLRRTLDQAIAAGRDRTHYDFAFTYADGREGLAEGWARIVRDRNGRAIRLLGTHLDVTERWQREQALRTGEAERRAILLTVPDAMFVCSDRGIIRACSASACRLFGYAEEDLIGRQVSDFIADGRPASAVRRELFRAFGRGAAATSPLRLDVRCESGKVIPVGFVVGTARRDGVRMVVVLGRDLRPAIASEERFHRMNNDLAQVSRLGMMGEMAGALAHELSQPLSAVVNFLGAAELMLSQGDRLQRERLRSTIDRASEQASRAGEIIRRLRAFILRGEADMRAERLADLVREAAALALFNANSFGVRLTYALEHEDRLVLGDRVQIQQVLVNLIRNAADAMAAHPGELRDLTISTRVTSDHLIEVAVRDTGPGIAPEILERLFNPFATTKREGLGFGLAISRRIVEAHGGQLSAINAPDGGAIFRFTLPVMDEEPVG